MEQRFLGDRTGLRVSRFALGTGRLGMKRDGAFEPEAARAVLDAFAEAGGNLIDTSSAYQLGRAETFVGTFLAEAGRDGFVVSSKYGRTAQAAPPPALVGSHRKAMMADIEGSLRRLRTDRIDLYFPHFDDGITPVEEIMAGLDMLVRSGKVLHLGFSNFPAWRIASAAMLAELRGWAPVAVLQLPYSLMERDADRELLPLAHARGLGVMGYSPLAGGGLAARLRAHAAGESNSNDEIADALQDIAGELGCDPMSAALAWVGARGIIPVIGARDGDQLAANLAAVGLRLSEAQTGRLDEVSRPVLGYPHQLLSQVRKTLGLASPRLGEIV